MFSYQSCSAYKKMQNSGLHLGDYHSDVTKQHLCLCFQEHIPQCLKLEFSWYVSPMLSYTSKVSNSMTKCAGNSLKFGLTWLPVVLRESEHCGIPQCVHIDGIQSMLLALYSDVHSKVTVAAA